MALLPHHLGWWLGCSLAVLLLAVRLSFPTNQRLYRPPPTTAEHRPVRLFVAVGTAPQNRELRDAARESWLAWARVAGQPAVKVRFFTDRESGSAQLDDRVRNEAAEHRDLVLQPMDTGYSGFADRALFQLQYARHHSLTMTHFLRVDDDGLLCLRRLLFELEKRPSSRFFWGKYWCRQDRFRADENFMLFSADVVEFVVQHAGSLLPLDRNCTFAWNFGFWSWMMNLTIFDDQARIDAQQSYLTDFMHSDHLKLVDSRDHQRFCLDYIYAHHVRSPEVMRGVYDETSRVDPHVYEIPVISPPRCESKSVSISPGLHSKTLPQVRIERLVGQGNR